MSTQAVARQEHAPGVARYDERFAYTQEQIQLIKSQCAKDATDDELQMFLHFCKESGVDPLRKQAHFVVRRYKDRNDNWQRTTQMIVGIDGFRKRAEEMPDFLGIRSSAVYAGENIELDYGKGEVSYKVNPLGRKGKGSVVGAFAIVYRRNRVPFIQWIDWSEYFDNRSPMHRDKPAVMCCKTAEATALRHEYPDKFSGMYAPEEMPQDYHVPSLMGDGDEPGPVGNVVQAEAEVVKEDPDDLDFPPSQVPTSTTKETLGTSTGPTSSDYPPVEFNPDLEGPPPEERNIPQEIRIAFGKILKGTETCLDVKFTRQQASDYLGQIMLYHDIPAMDYVEADGLVHTKKMQNTREGMKHANDLLRNLKGEGALDAYKKIAQSKVLVDPVYSGTFFENPQTPNEDSAAPEQAEQDPKPTSDEELRKSIAEIQAAMNKDHGIDGVKLGVEILKTHGKSKDLRATHDEMVAVYTRLCGGTVTAAEILKERS